MPSHSLPVEVYAHLANQITRNSVLALKLTTAASEDDEIAERLFKVLEDSVFLVLKVKLRDDVEQIKGLVLDDLVPNSNTMCDILDILYGTISAFDTTIIVHSRELELTGVTKHLWQDEPENMEIVKSFYLEMATIIPFMVSDILKSFPNRYYELLAIFTQMSKFTDSKDIDSAKVLLRLHTLKQDPA